MATKSGSETAATKAARAVAGAKTAVDNPLANAFAKMAMAALTAKSKEKNALSDTAIEANKPEIVADMTEAIAASPKFQHVANTEPFWRKRSFYGTVAGLATALGVGAIYIAEKMAAGGEASELSLTLIIGALWAAWSSFRAGTATKPLWS